MEQNLQNQPQKLQRLLPNQKLTKQDLKFVEKVVEDGNVTKAAQEAYKVDYGYANVKGHRMIQKDLIKEAIDTKVQNIRKALIDQGVDDTKIAEKVSTLLEANKVVRTYIKGDLVTETEEEDHNAIDKGLKHALNVFGIEEKQPPKSGNTYNFFFNPELRQKVTDVENDIKKALLEDVK